MAMTIEQKELAKKLLQLDNDIKLFDCFEEYETELKEVFPDHYGTFANIIELNDKLADVLYLWEIELGEDSA